jgi:hypothetical protein
MSFILAAAWRSSGECKTLVGTVAMPVTVTVRPFKGDKPVAAPRQLPELSPSFS